MGKQQPKMAVTTQAWTILIVLSGLGFDWSSYQIDSLLGNNRPDVLSLIVVHTSLIRIYLFC